MDKQNTDKLQEEAEKKHRKREKRRKAKMKVSGAGVKVLQRIISKKSKNNLSLRGVRRGRRSNLGKAL